MLNAALVLSVVTLAIWLYLLLLNGQFWLLSRWIDEDQRCNETDSWPGIVAIIPARNEAATIRKTVESILNQDYPGELSVVVVDDHSEDDTAALAQQLAQRVGSAKSLNVVRSQKLAVGWTGKLWALENGVQETAAKAPEFFWFTDADIVHAKDTLRRLVLRAESQKLDMASLMVLLQARTFAEKLLIPPFLYFFLMLYPPARTANANSNVAGAAGGCVLLRRSALERIGGLNSIRAEVIDDCSLARAVKQSGGKIWMGLTRASISLRSYGTFAEIRDMIARTAFTQLRYSVLLLAGTLIGMLVTYIAPVALLAIPHGKVLACALAAWLLMTISFLPTVRYFKLSPIWAPLLPLAALFYTYATWISAIRYWMGRGGQWKGRVQASK